jgi:tRNA-dihydrouridine synthase
MNEQSQSIGDKIKQNALFFAPMEGVTNAVYRKVIHQLYPQWDYYATDFLRIPGQGVYPKKHLIKHIGKQVLEDPQQLHKTLFQVLTTADARNEDNIKNIVSLGVPWIDLNLGCPSQTVVKKKGGSYLLSDLKNLARLLGQLRSWIPVTFTTKIRVGFRDDQFFSDILSVIEDAGVDAITIHGRTREQLYKGIANWKYIKQAVETTSVPIVGNGDIWEAQDVEKIQHQTNCHAIMLARGALKRPWFAKTYKTQGSFTPENDLNEALRYLNCIQTAWQEDGLKEKSILKASKGLIRYLFDIDLPQLQKTKRELYLSKNLAQFQSILPQPIKC